MSGSAPLLFLERLYIFCLETTTALSSPSDEGRAFMGESGGMSSKVRENLLLAPSSSVFLFDSC